MHRRRLNRREAIGLGAAALAGGALRPRSALAAGTSLFELAIDEGAVHVADGLSAVETAAVHGGLEHGFGPKGPFP